MKQGTLFRMFYLLLQHRKMTAETLSKILNISIRSVFRYVDELSYAGIPIYCKKGHGGGIFLADSFVLSAAVFTEEEYRTLTESLLSFHAADSERPTTEILEKLNAIRPRRQGGYVLGTETLLIDHTPWGDVSTSNQKLKLLEEAIFRSVTVRIEYHDAQSRISKRIIEPHLLLLKQGEWYIYAFCRLKAEFRLFKLTRIVSMDLQELNFKRREIRRDELDFDRFLTERRSLISVEFSFRAEILTDMEEWLSVEKIQPLNDGTYYAKVELYSDFNLLSKILSMGKALTVLSPESLQNELRHEVQMLAEIYGKSNQAAK